MNPDVFVVGAGPVGMTMAAELARYGVSVRIVDKAAARTDKSKALVVWSRTLELLNRAGCSASFVNSGMKVIAAKIIAGDRDIGHIRLDTIRTPYPYALMIPQSETERLLEEHLNSFGVCVEREVELTGFDHEADGVTSRLRFADGHEETVRSAWLIGCDGAHSTVRHRLAMPFEGDTQPSDWVLADLRLAGLNSDNPEILIFWHKEGTMAIFPIAAGRYRVIADMGEAQSDEHRADPTLEEVQQILETRGPGGITASEPFWLSSFRINERKVADYRAGRVFLAGDAAHVHSPAGGQGMNTGMQDACNLAWKLALVHRGLAAPEPLLGSYSVERSEVGRQVLRDAGRLTTLAILRGPVVQEVRNVIASIVFGLSPARTAMANKLAELSIGYPESPLTASGRETVGAMREITQKLLAVGEHAYQTTREALNAAIEAARAGQHGKGSADVPDEVRKLGEQSQTAAQQVGDLACPAPGERAPVTENADPVGAGSTPRFALFAQADAHAAELIARFRDVLEPEVRKPFAEGGIWLVRPDGYVAVVASQNGWTEIEDYLRKVLGRFDGQH